MTNESTLSTCDLLGRILRRRHVGRRLACNLYHAPVTGIHNPTDKNAKAIGRSQETGRYRSRRAFGLVAQFELLEPLHQRTDPLPARVLRERGIEAECDWL